jgi:hypothetical protein
MEVGVMDTVRVGAGAVTFALQEAVVPPFDPTQLQV